MAISTPGFARHAVLVKTASFLGVTGKLEARDNVVHLITDELWAPPSRCSPSTAGAAVFTEQFHPGAVYQLFSEQWFPIWAKTSVWYSMAAAGHPGVPVTRIYSPSRTKLMVE